MTPEEKLILEGIKLVMETVEGIEKKVNYLYNRKQYELAGSKAEVGEWEVNLGSYDDN